MRTPSGGDILLEYYLKYEEDFKQSLKKLKKKASEKDIHHFRVSTKKLKSLFKLIALCDTGFDASLTFKKFQSLFQTAGEVRECQVNLLRISEMEVEKDVLDAFAVWQKKQTKKKKKKFIKAVARFKKKNISKTHDLVKSSCNGLLTGSIVEKALDFINEKRSGIKELSKSEISIPSIHNIRIKLKQISTILGLLNSLDVVGHQPAKDVDLKKYENELGIWHDRVMLKDTLLKYQKHVKKNTPQHIDPVNKLIDFLDENEKRFISNIDFFVNRVLDTISLDNL